MVRHFMLSVQGAFVKWIPGTARFHKEAEVAANTGLAQRGEVIGRYSDTPNYTTS
jgi:hypothetical protein